MAWSSVNLVNHIRSLFTLVNTCFLVVSFIVVSEYALNRLGDNKQPCLTALLIGTRFGIAGASIFVEYKLNFCFTQNLSSSVLLLIIFSSILEAWNVLLYDIVSRLVHWAFLVLVWWQITGHFPSTNCKYYSHVGVVTCKNLFLLLLLVQLVYHLSHVLCYAGLSVELCLI